MNSVILSLIALIPAVLLCWYIYEKDRVEKEPALLLLLLFVAGAVVYLPVIHVENGVIRLVDKWFASGMVYSLTGVPEFLSESVFLAHSATVGFVCIALIEESVKWVLLYLISNKNRDFDHLFDGIVYAVFLALGFAAMENIFHAVRDGWSTFVLRSLTTVPGHMTFGVLMGFCYAMWHTYGVACKKEKELALAGEIVVEKPFSSGIWMVTGLICPVLLHGAYSFLESFTSDVMTVIFYVFVILLYVLCFYVVHQMSDADSPDDRVVDRLIRKKYPERNKG